MEEQQQRERERWTQRVGENLPSFGSLSHGHGDWGKARLKPGICTSTWKQVIKRVGSDTLTGAGLEVELPEHKVYSLMMPS